MYRVGLTGGIGAGKSTVARIFEVLGIPVFSADKVGRALLDEHAAVKKEVLELLGEQAYAKGVVNRKFIAKKVFEQEELRAALNKIIHPRVREALLSWKPEVHTPYLIYEAAILFESGGNKLVHASICVTAPESVRAERVALRDGSTAQEVQQRMAAQWSQRKIAALCDFVIDNGGSELVIPQVVHIHHRLLQKLSEH